MADGNKPKNKSWRGRGRGRGRGYYGGKSYFERKKLDPGNLRIFNKLLV